MATSEFDPLFVKGLRLLHSKSKDSTEQLKQLLDEVIAQSKQSTNTKDRIYTSVKLEGEGKLHIKKASRDTSEVSSLTKYSSEETRERKAEKRQIEKAKQEQESEAKIPKLEPPQVYSYYPSSPDLPKLDPYIPKREEDSDSSDENADADDFAMEIMEMGLACVICNQIEYTQGNQLIECLECHSLYHQECHRPPATDYNSNDPRRVWYCAKCVKNMKKMATKTQKTAKSGVTVPPKEPLSLAKSVKSESSPPGLILPFKRSELKTPISQDAPQTVANKPIGLASLAANFGSRTTTTASSTSATPAVRGSKTTSSSTSLKSSTPFSSTSTSKTSSIATASSLLKMPTTSSAFQNLTSATTSQSSITTTSQKASSTTSATKGLGLLSAAVATASSRAAASAAAGNGGNSHKVANCSPLMNADKRLQIMKKKASKLQERRRLSTK